MTAQARILLLVLVATILTACAAIVKPTALAEWPVNIESHEVIFIDPPLYSQSEFECLRMNIYHEAGNQNKRGKEAVALVTLTRTKVKHFPPTVCEVVHQGSLLTGIVSRNNCQFSWYCDGKPDAPNLKHPMERKQWEASGEVAKNALLNRIPDFLGGATHYHANYVRPDFSLPQHRKRYNLLTNVGVHLFYRDIALKPKAA